MESKELGLVLGEKLLGLEELHYGYWKTPPKEEKDFTVIEIIQAQKAYTKLIISQIEKYLPKKSSRILDVGCGTGSILVQLLKKGYKVDGVIPSLYLQKRVEKKIKAAGVKTKPHIFACGFEDVLKYKKNYKYGLIFFSESFQYIPMESSFSVLSLMLEKDGAVIISDFFKREVHNPEYTHLVGGGHLLKDFYQVLKNSSFTKTKELDITKNCSPTIEIGSYLFSHRLYPSIQLLDNYLLSRYKIKYSLLRKTITRFGKKGFQKFKEKYLLGKRTGLSFEKSNKYLIAILKQK